MLLELIWKIKKTRLTSKSFENRTERYPKKRSTSKPFENRTIVPQCNMITPSMRHVVEHALYPRHSTCVPSMPKSIPKTVNAGSYWHFALHCAVFAQTTATARRIIVPPSSVNRNVNSYVYFAVNRSTRQKDRKHFKWHCQITTLVLKTPTFPFADVFFIKRTTSFVRQQFKWPIFFGLNLW